MSTVAITVDGVLRKVVGQTPITIGMELYKALAQVMHVVLVHEDPDEDAVKQFFWTNGVVEQVKTVGPDMSLSWMDEPDRRVQQINRVRSLGQNVQLVVEPNPEISSYLIMRGYNVLTFTPAEYTVPSWRPDYKPEFETEEGHQFAQPWNSLTIAVAKQAEMKALDDRLKDEQRPTQF